jgi:Zn-dependent peptidase ImmA (M78 family)
MDKALERITKSRQLLQNPYAYLDGHGSYSALLEASKPARSLGEQIAESRQLLQDPYAYLDGDGKFNALPKFAKLDINVSKKKRYLITEIEQKAKELQRKIWRNKDKIWGASRPTDPVDMLDPSVALKLIGYSFDLDESLGQYHNHGRLLEAAGLIDSQSRSVRISRQFKSDIRIFTTAHELGHALLHEARGLHRDRPLNGTTRSRDVIEFEADKFATYFLMPEKLVKARFADLFATDLFVVNEETAFGLSLCSLNDFNKKCKTLRDLSRLLSSAERYNGIHFISLASQFRISIEAMAIRLEELGLLAI